MHCPFCHNEHSKVIDSRVIDGGTAIRRRRECSSCEGRFTTIEKAQLLVVKRNGLTEPFSREKVIVGVRRACQGRDVSDDSLKTSSSTSRRNGAKSRQFSNSRQCHWFSYFRAITRIR